MKCQEVRDGETIISIIRNVLVLATITTTATDPTKQTSGQSTRQTVGTKAKGLQDHIDPGVSPLCTH